MNQKRTISEVDREHESIGPTKRLKLINTNDSSVKKKIEKIIKREFFVEICKKEEEILLINDRLAQAKRLLDRLRACIIASYYGRAMCGSNNQQQTSKTDAAQATPIHPTVKRLLGKTVRLPVCDMSDIKPTVGLSETSISRKSASSGYTSGTTSRASSASSSLSSITNNDCSTTTKRWNPSKITKRIVIGNVSKYLAAGKKDASDAMRYKWMVYVQGAMKDDRDISHFVDKVVFMLDESYRPNHVITVSQPPFTLKRHGWGEFPVRVQLHFKGSATKCVDIIHELKLDKTHTGWTTLGAETTYDINVDNNLFIDGHSVNFTSPQVSPRRRNHRLSAAAVSATIASATELELVAAVKAEPLDETYYECNSSVLTHQLSTNYRETVRINSMNDALCGVVCKSEPCSPDENAMDSVAQTVHNDSIGEGDIGMFLPQGTDTTPSQHMKLNVFDHGVSVTTVSPSTSSGAVSESDVTVSAARSPRSDAAEDHSVFDTKLEPASPDPEVCGKPVGSVPWNGQSSQLDVCPTAAVECETSLQRDCPVDTRIDESVHMASDLVSAAVDAQVSADRTMRTTSAAVQVISSGMVLTDGASTNNFCSRTSTPKSAAPCQLVTGVSTQISSSLGRTSSGLLMQSLGGVQSVSCSTGTTPVSKNEQFISCRDTSGRMLLIPKSLLASMQVASSGQVLSTNVVSGSMRTVAKAMSVSTLSSPTPLTLSVVAKNSAVARNLNNAPKDLALGCATATAMPQLSLATGVRGTIRSAGSPRAILSGPRAAACAGNMAFMVKSNQLTKGQFFTSSPGSRLFMPSGARPIEKASLTSSTGNNIIIRPASPIVAGTARLQASTSSIFVLPEVRKSVPARQGFPLSGASTVCLSVPRQQLAKAAVSKPESTTPLYFLVENSSSKAAVANNKQTPVQFLVMPDTSSATRSETPVRLTGTELRAVPRGSRPYVTASASTLATKSGIRTAFVSASPLVCLSVSNNTPVTGETMAMSVARMKSSGQISLLRAAQTTVVDSVSTTAKSLSAVANSLVLPGTKTFATKIGGQTVIVDMVGSSPSGVNPLASCSRSLLTNGVAPNITSMSSQHLPTIGKDRLLNMKNMRELLIEKKVAADSTTDIISNVNQYGSMECLVRVLANQYPLFASDIDRSLHPYCAPSWDAFLGWNVGKRRAAELCRAKKIQDRILRSLNGARSFRGEEIWSWRRIIIWCRRHLYTPLDTEICCRLKEATESTVTNSVTPLDPLLDTLEGSNERQTALSTESETEIDVIEIDDEPIPSASKKDVVTPTKSSGLLKEYLPASLEGQFVHEVLDQFGMRPNPVAVEGFPSVFASAVEEMIARSMKLLVDDMLRTTASIMFDSGRKPTELNAVDIHQCLVSRDKFDFLTNKHMGVTIVDDDLQNTSDCDT